MGFEEVVCGLMLGDGSLERRGNARLKVLRKQEHAEYNVWLKALLIDDFDFGPDQESHTQDARTDKEYHGSRIKTHADERLTVLHTLWYADKKVVPVAFVEQYFTALSLAIWYLDDGTLTRTGKQGYYRTVLATNCFSHEEVAYLSELLARRFGIKAHVTPWQGRYVLRMFQEESTKLLDVVGSVLPAQGLECMQYKLQMMGRL